jgi:hypothetical protein
MISQLLARHRVMTGEGDKAGVKLDEDVEMK